MALNIDYILLIIFGLILIIVMYLNRHRLKIEKFLFPLFYIVMYRTKVGLNAMDKYAKRYPRSLEFFGSLSIIVGFVGMVFVFYEILLSSYVILLNPTTANEGAKLLLPGVQIPGLPRLSFFHWIITIFVLAVVHEFSHGVVARLYNVKIKSSGFAVLGILLPLFPAAFVEPDEKQLSKKSRKAQLSVAAAGPFSNLLLAGFIFIILQFLLNPFTASLVESNGIVITNLDNEYPSFNVGISVGEKIEEINGVIVSDVDGFINEVEKINPGEEVVIKTNNSFYNLVAAQHPKENDRGYLGVSVAPENVGYKEAAVEKFGLTLKKVFFWFDLLIYWLFFINLVVGLINLFPIMITDGARMAYIGLSFFIEDELKLKKVWGLLNIFCIFLLLVNFLPSVIKYFLPILSV